MQRESIQLYDSGVVEEALAAYLLSSLQQKNRQKRVKINMECRRKLEALNEEKRLQKETQDYCFE